MEDKKHLITLGSRIREIYPDIDDYEMIKIGETVVEMAREGIKIDEIFKALKNIK